MSLNNILEIIVACVVGWIAYLELSLKITKTKLFKSEQKEKLNALREKVHSMSDHDLDAELTDKLGPGDKKP